MAELVHFLDEYEEVAEVIGVDGVVSATGMTVARSCSANPGVHMSGRVHMSANRFRRFFSDLLEAARAAGWKGFRICGGGTFGDVVREVPG